MEAGKTEREGPERREEGDRAERRVAGKGDREEEKEARGEPGRCSEPQDRQTKGGETERAPPIPLHLDPALTYDRLTSSVFRPRSLSRGLPAPPAVMFKCPFLKWSQMVDVSQLAFDNQMLSSHKGVLQPGCWLGASIRFADHCPLSMPETQGQALPQPLPPGGAPEAGGTTAMESDRAGFESGPTLYQWLWACGFEPPFPHL